MTSDLPPTDRVDTELLEQATAIVLHQMRVWGDEDELAGAYETKFDAFDPLE